MIKTVALPLLCWVAGAHAFGAADCGDKGMEDCMDTCFDCVPCWFATTDSSDSLCHKDGASGCSRCEDCQNTYQPCVSGDCQDPVTNLCRIECGVCAHCLAEPDGDGCDSARCVNCDNSECAERARSGFIDPSCATLPAVNPEKIPEYCSGDEYDTCKAQCSSCITGMLCDQIGTVMDPDICENIAAKDDCDHCLPCQKYFICAGHDCSSDYVSQCESDHFCGECYECIQDPEAAVCSSAHCVECANFCGWVSPYCVQQVYGVDGKPSIAKELPFTLE